MSFRTIIIPASKQANAQALCAGLAGMAGAGMFTTALSPTGSPPATHYASSGVISDQMAALLPNLTTGYAGQPAMVPALALTAGITVSLAQVNALYSVIDVSEDEPFAAIARLGLMLAQEAI